MSERDQQVSEKQALSKIIFKEGFDNKELFKNSTELISFVQMWLETYEPDWDSEFYMKVLSDKYLFMKKINPDAPTIGNISGLPVMAERMYMSFNKFMSWLYLFDYSWTIEGNLDTTITFDGDIGVITSRLKDTNAVINKIGINLAIPSTSKDINEVVADTIMNQNLGSLFGVIDRKYLPYLIVLIALIILALLFF